MELESGSSPVAGVAAGAGGRGGGAELATSTSGVVPDPELALLWGPLPDGDLLSETPLDVIRHSGSAEISVLVGTTENEFSWRLLRDRPDSEEACREGRERLPTNCFGDQPKRSANTGLQRRQLQLSAASSGGIRLRCRTPGLAIHSTSRFSLTTSLLPASSPIPGPTRPRSWRHSSTIDLLTSSATVFPDGRNMRGTD